MEILIGGTQRNLIMESKNLVFVYGTLRENHSNHHLLKDADCYGIGRTVDNYAMYLVSGYPYITSSESRYPIVGELYGVDDKTLSELDKMEGHPTYYERREIGVIVGEVQYSAWTYLRKPPGILLQSGDFNDANFLK